MEKWAEAGGLGKKEAQGVKHKRDPLFPWNPGWALLAADSRGAPVVLSLKRQNSVLSFAEL